MIARVPWSTNYINGQLHREPSLPDGIAFHRIVEDHGDEVSVEITDPRWPPHTSKAALWSHATDAEAEQNLADSSMDVIIGVAAAIA